MHPRQNVRNSDKTPGIFLENDLVALRSSDDVLDDPKTRSTVMAKRGNPESVPNWLIMSKPGSPFLKTWMQEYEGASDEQSWQQLATGTPWDLAKNNDPDVTVLSADTWFHPITTEPDLDSSLTKMWFGKSWDNIDKSYGTHVWHWVGSLKSSITPEAVRSIDTPLFCRLRKLFDNLEGDGYYSIPSDKNLNCSIIQIGDLSQKDLGLFSDYRVTLHDTDIKWVDSSGFNNHGWAPSGTPVAHDGSGVFRNITTGSYAVLPVPAGWDSRMWTARVGFRIDPRMLTPGSEAGLFKIRFEGDGEILVRMSGKRKPSQVVFQVDWSEGAKFAEEAKQYDQQRDIIWVPVSGLRNLQEDLHELAITFDRRDYGGVQIFIDGKEIGSKRLPLIDSFKAGQDIWLNARNWDELDTGFRGLLSRFTMYADALSPEDIANPISYTTAAHTASGLYVNVAHVKETSGSKFLVGVFFMFLLLYLLLQRKPLIRDMPWFIREAVRKLWRIGEALAKA